MFGLKILEFFAMFQFQISCLKPKLIINDSEQAGHVKAPTAASKSLPLKAPVVTLLHHFWGFKGWG